MLILIKHNIQIFPSIQITILKPLATLNNHTIRDCVFQEKSNNVIIY